MSGASVSSPGVGDETLAAGRVTASVYTSPHTSPSLDPEPALVALLGNAKHTIRFAAYSLTLPSVAAALIAAHKRGVDVRGVGDATEWARPTSQFPSLLAAGVDVRAWGGNYRLMHDKLAVVDGKAVALGSFNWTAQAERNNVEVLLVTNGTAGAAVLAPTLTQQIETAYDAGRVPPAVTAKHAKVAVPRRVVAPTLAQVTASAPMPAQPAGNWTNPAFWLGIIPTISLFLTMFFHSDLGLSAHSVQWSIVACSVVGFGAYLARAVKHHAYGQAIVAWLNYLSATGATINGGTTTTTTDPTGTTTTTTTTDPSGGGGAMDSPDTPVVDG